jgi:hypothetical protein
MVPLLSSFLSPHDPIWRSHDSLLPGSIRRYNLDEPTMAEKLAILNLLSDVDGGGGAVDCHGGSTHRGLSPRPAQVGSKGRRPHRVAGSKVSTSYSFQSRLCSYVISVVK